MEFLAGISSFLRNFSFAKGDGKGSSDTDFLNINVN